jgi:hypothetical protein
LKYASSFLFQHKIKVRKILTDKETLHAYRMEKWFEVNQNKLMYRYQRCPWRRRRCRHRCRTATATALAVRQRQIFQ